MKIMIRDGKGVHELAPDNNIFMGTQNGHLKLFVDPNMTFDDSMSVIFTSLRHIMERHARSEEVRENIYDYVNLAASTILDDFMPQFKDEKLDETEIVQELS